MISYCFDLHHCSLSVLCVVFCHPVLHCSVLSLPVIEGSDFSKTVKLMRKCLIYCQLSTFPSMNSTRGTTAEQKERWVPPVALNTCVVCPQREAAPRSIYHCGGVHHPRKAPLYRRPRWSSSRTSSATFPCWRGGRRRTSLSVSDRDEGMQVEGQLLSGGCGVGAAVMHNVCVCVFRPLIRLVSVACQLKLTERVIRLFLPLLAAPQGPRHGDYTSHTGQVSNMLKPCCAQSTPLVSEAILVHTDMANLL